MTPDPNTRSLVAPLASAAITALVMAGALWLQHSRAAWPFNPTTTGPRDAAATGMTGMTDLSATVDHPDRVPIDASAAPGLEIRLEPVRREALSEPIRAVATITPDESRFSHVHTRVAGWLEHLEVSTTGAVVHAGQPVAHIFSQELLSSQTEYLAARRYAAATGITSAVVAGGRTRLSVLGMTPSEIEAVETSGEPTRLVTVVAPASGVVIARGVTAGTSVDPSTTILTIADLSQVWVLAEVPETSITAIRVGLPATLDFPASGRAPFTGRVEFVSPTLTERTRTLRVRLTALNPTGSLRPGLYGTASFTVAGAPAITVPRDAIVDTGARQHVFVAVGDRFEPRVVTLGLQLADRVEVRSGLSEGEHVVASGVFLLDSESRLRATGGAGGHNHGAPASTPASSGKPAADPHAGHRE